MGYHDEQRELTVQTTLIPQDARRRHRHEGLGSFGEAAADPRRVEPRQLRDVGPSGGVLAQMGWASVGQGLGPRERQAVGLSLDGWSNREIAEHMGYASGASVAVILTRARAKVRRAFPVGPQRDVLLGEVRVY